MSMMDDRRGFLTFFFFDFFSVRLFVSRQLVTRSAISHKYGKEEDNALCGQRSELEENCEKRADADDRDFSHHSLFVRVVSALGVRKNRRWSRRAFIWPSADERLCHAPAMYQMLSQPRRPRQQQAQHRRHRGMAA